MEEQQKNFVIGIDVGGTKISTAIADLEGAIIEKITLATGAIEGEEAVMDRIIQSVDMVLEASGIPASEVRTIGIGAPGPQDTETGAIITTPNLPFRNFSLTQPLEKRFGIPAHLDNDGNVAAIGEWMFGAGKGFSNVIYMTVSTGVGGGAVLNGKPYHGARSNAMEIGHMTIDAFSPHRCNCGNYGDVEALASGTAIASRAKEALAEGRDSLLKRHEVITSYEVYQAYKEGDPLSIEILDKAWEYLGIAVANIILTFDPEVIAIGGGVSRIGEDLFSAVRSAARKHCFEFMFDSVQIVPTGLKQDTGVQGAVAFALVMGREELSSVE